MITKEGVDFLYSQAKYREVIAAVGGLELDARDSGEAEILLVLAWSHHQLKEYRESLVIFEELMMRYSFAETEKEAEIRLSALRGTAHGLLQTGADFERVERIIVGLPPSLDLDNVYLNTVLVRARKGEKISVNIVLEGIWNAIATVPYKTVNGHVIRNGVLALHVAREQEVVKPYLASLPGLMFVAIKIYNETQAAKNHLASATFFASQICEAAGWLKMARIEAETSHALWKELAGSQGGEGFQKNLEGAEAQLKKLESI